MSIYAKTSTNFQRSAINSFVASGRVVGVPVGASDMAPQKSLIPVTKRQVTDVGDALIKSLPPCLFSFVLALSFGRDRLDQIRKDTDYKTLMLEHERTNMSG